MGLILYLDTQKGRASNLKQDLDKHHKLAFPLMQW